MAEDKSILLQKQVRNNSEDLQSEFLDMKNWEEQMKKADTEIRDAGGDQILPPVRRKKKASKDAQKPQNKENETMSKRIKSYDYSAWEKFDVNKACEEVDRDQSDDHGEEPLTKEELEKNHTEATRHKDEGNIYVKKQLWEKAVACYSKAITVFPYDAVFFSNRALCHLKMDNLYSAEADCTAAVQLDEFYIKAYHRRATARISLKRYQEAAQDINKILKLEPFNKEAQTMLARVNKSIENSKPLIISTACNEINESIAEEKIDDKLLSSTVIKELELEKAKVMPVTKEIEKKNEKEVEEPKKQIEIESNPIIPEWIPEVHENFDIVKVITKPPHQRSKKPLKTVLIEEIEFGSKLSNSKDLKMETTCRGSTASDSKIENSLSRITDSGFSCTEVPAAPKTAVQFLLTWRKNKSTEFRHEYLKQIPAERIPILFQDSMESNTFSEILKVLRSEFTKHKEPVLDYLRHLSEVKRFRTLTMFMSKLDKEDVQALFDYSKIVEGQCDKVIEDLRLKYEM